MRLTILFLSVLMGWALYQASGQPLLFVVPLLAGVIVARLIGDGDEARLVVSELRDEFAPIPPEAERRMIGPQLGEIDVLEAGRVIDAAGPLIDEEDAD